MPLIVRWFPPAWVQIKSAGAIIYIDPAYMTTYFADYPKKKEFSKWPEPVDGMPDGLEPADAILVTHAHRDHCKWLTIKRLCKAGTQIYAPAACGAEIAAPINHVRAGDSFCIGQLQVRAVPAYNIRQGNAKVFHHPSQSVGYLVTGEKRTAYHAGDTDLIPEMKALGKVHIAMLPIGGKYVMGIDDAVCATLEIAPKIAVPMHYIGKAGAEFKKKLAQKNPKIRALALAPGGIARIR